MDNFLAGMKEWQSLAGAILGAIASLSIAFLVVYLNRRREDIASAMLITSDLISIKAADRSLTELAKEKKVDDKDYPMFLAGRLVASRPRISPLFEGSVARLMPVDTSLAAHLDLFTFIYRDIEHILDRIVRDVQFFQENNKFLRSEDSLRADAEVVRKGFKLAAMHARCAERLLSKLVLSKWPTVHRMRSAFFPSKLEKQCEEFLKTGTL